MRLSGLTFRRTMATMLAVIGITGLTLPAMAEPPSARDFAMKKTAGLLELGPKGQHAAFLSRTYSQICRSEYYKRRPPNKCKAKKRRLAPTDQIVIVDVESRTAKTAIPVPEDMTINWIKWASADTLLVSLTTSWEIKINGYTPPTGRIVSFNIHGDRDPVTLFGDDLGILRNNRGLSGVVDLLRSDPEHVAMGAWHNNDYDLFRVNLKTGEPTRIAKGKSLTYSWKTDRSGAPAIRMDCRSRRCEEIRVFRPQDNADPNDEDTEWIFVRSFKRIRKGDRNVVEYDWISPAEVPGQYYVAVEGTDYARRKIEIFDVRTNQFVEDVFEDATYDVAGGFTDPETGLYAGAIVWRDRIAYIFDDERLQRHIDAINAFFDDRWNVFLTGFSETAQLAIVWASAPNDPGAYYIYDFEKRSVDHLVSSYRDMPAELPTQTETVTLPMRDGASITGYHTRPANRDSKGLIVLVHGGPEARDVYDYDRDVQFLATRGFEVLQINFRGSAGYGRDFALAGYRQWSGTMHNDVIDSTRHLIEQEREGAKPICIMGHSYGGYAALLAGAFAPDLYDCVIAGAGPSDLFESLRYEKFERGPDSSSLDYWTRHIGDIKEDREKLRSISPVNLVDRYDDPILLIHGRGDNIVSYEHTRRMDRALRKASKDVTLLDLKEGHYHNHWSIESSTEYFETLERFLDDVFKGE